MKKNKKMSKATLLIVIFAFSALTMASLIQTPVQAVLPSGCPQGMTHYWPLDETDDTCPVTYDDYVDGVDGGCASSGGPTPTDGQVNGAQMFPGGTTGQGIDVPDDDTLDWLADDLFSIELWVKRPGPISENDVAIGRDDGSVHWWIGVGAKSPVNPHSAAAVFRDKDGGGDIVILKGISSITDGRWYHIAVVKTSTDMILYVNGVAEDTQTASFSSDFDSTTPLNIGWLSLDDKYSFDGCIDEVAMFNRALSENEVKCHYTLGLFEKGYCEQLACECEEKGTTGLSLFGTVKCEGASVLVGATSDPDLWRAAPAGTQFAQFIDSTAAALLWGIGTDGVLYWDVDSSVVNQGTGQTSGTGHEIISGGPVVNAPVKWYEGQKLAPVYYKTVAGQANFFSTEGTPGTGDDIQLLAAQLAWSEVGPRKDIFVIELFQKPGSDPAEYVVISYGYAGRGTLAASVWFKIVVEPNLSGFTDPYYIVQWDDTNANGHPDVPSTDTYTVLFGTVPP